MAPPCTHAVATQTDPEAKDAAAWRTVEDSEESCSRWPSLAAPLRPLETVPLSPLALVPPALTKLRVAPAHCQSAWRAGVAPQAVRS